MSRWAIWVVLLALALPAGGGPSLQCERASAGMAPMPCCQELRADCGEPGMTRDCCRLVPADVAPVALSASVSVQEELWHARSLTPIMPPSGWNASTYDLAEPRRQVSRAPHLHAPPSGPRTPVLRI